MPITSAATAADYAAFATLVRDYVDWCRARYAQEAWLVDRVFSEQALARELEDLAASYAPPHGRVLLAREAGEICGGGAYRRLSAEACEMKRLFVRERFRGKGFGRALCNALVAAAARDGFKFMRLDTMSLMTGAIALYESAGFRPCAPYNDYPAEVMRYIRFMELGLA